MSEHLFIADLIRELGDNADIVHTIRRYISNKFPGSSKTEWIARPDQLQLLENELVHRLDGGVSSANLVHTRILALSNNGFKAATFHVMSYDGAVFELASSLNNASRVVVSHHLAEVRKNAVGSMSSHVPRVSPGAGGVSKLSVEEAIELAKRVLHQGAHVSKASSLQLTQLRPLMMFADSRARKDPTDPVSLQLMKYVVKNGIEEGWLGFSSLLPGKDVVWLESRSSLVLCHPTTDSSTHSQDTTPGPASSSDGNKPASAGYAEGASGDMADGKTKGVDAQPQEPKRWQIFNTILWDLGIAPPAIALDYFCNAVEQILRDGQPLAVGQLTSEACCRAKAAVENNGENDPKWKWPSISRCCERILVGANVLIDKNGVPIRPGIGSISAQVSSAEANLRDRCHAFQLYQIILHCHDVKLRERGSLGLAFLRRGKERKPIELEEIRNRVDFLLDFLKGQGRIDDSGEFLSAI